MKIFLFFLAIFLSSNLWGSENSHKEMPKHDWSFKKYPFEHLLHEVFSFDEQTKHALLHYIHFCCV